MWPQTTEPFRYEVGRDLKQDFDGEIAYRAGFEPPVTTGSVPDGSD